MALETAARKPARMSIANIGTGDSIEAQFNPTELEETLDVSWARLTVPGLSHQPLQFVNTGNTKMSFELQFEAQDPAATLDQLLRSRRFLQSLCYPRQGASNVTTGGPPRALFIWPNIVSLTCVLTALAFRYTRFNIEGTPIEFACRVSLEEIRDVRLTSEDVLSDGTQRSGSAAESV